MNYATFDIETVPSTTIPKDLIPQFDPTDVKLGNIKDQVKINEKIKKARQEFDEGLNKKMSLDPDLCEVVCCGIYRSEINRTKIYVSIQEIWEMIEQIFLSHTPLVSFNGIQFDLPVLWHSAMRLGIPVSPQMYFDLTKRSNNRFHYDLLQLLSGWQRDKYKSLEFYLKLFGIGDKLGKGSEIYEWWKNEESEKIRIHCEQDVNLTAKLFEKLKSYIVKEGDIEWQNIS